MPTPPEQLTKEQLERITALHQRLTEQVEGSAEQMVSPGLRERVQTLVPIWATLKKLGKELMHGKSSKQSGRALMLYYFQQNIRQIISREELAIVSGIDDYPRRIRELRKKFGWSIVSGITAKESAAESEDGLLDGIDVSTMYPDDYILLSEIQDTESAERWNLANTIRRLPGVSGKERIRRYLTHDTNVGKLISAEILRYVTKDANDWGRRVRELRTEDAWPVVKARGGYILQENKQGEPHDRNIPQGIYASVLDRDEHACRKCGWKYTDAHPGDPRKRLELHHIEHHRNGGTNTEDNLITLCNVHHDEVHAMRPPFTPAQLFAWLEA